MNTSNLLRIAFSALRRNKLRAFLTMLGIIIGVASVIAMLAIGQGSKNSIQEQLSSMGTNMLFVRPGADIFGGVRGSAEDAQSLTLQDVEALRLKATTLSGISPEVRSSGQVIFANNNWPTTMYGTSTEYFDIRKLTIKSGSAFTERDIATAAKVVLLGQTVVENLFGENADPIGTTIRFNNIPFKIVGVLDEKGESSFGQDQDDVMIAPYTTVMKRILAITYIQGIYASSLSEDLSQQAVEEMEVILREEHQLKDDEDNDFNIRSQQELVSTFSSTTEIMTSLLATIAGISLIVGGIGIMNIMYVSVTERTREIGLRMAVGGRGGDILFQFLIEAVLLSITGGIIGVALGIGSSLLVADMLGWPTVITSSSILLSFVFCTLIGIFFGWYPARKAAQLDPIDALRYE